MGRPVRSDGRIAAAIAALGQNVIEGRRQRHPPVSPANHEPIYQPPTPTASPPSPTPEYPPQARRGDAAASGAFNTVSRSPTSSTPPTQHKFPTPSTHHQVSHGQLARVTAIDPLMQSAIRRHRDGSAPLARSNRRNIAAQLEQHAAVYEELCTPTSQHPSKQALTPSIVAPAAHQQHRRGT